METWWIVLGMAAVTFGVRYPVLALAGKAEIPPSLLRALNYVPATILTAILVPEVLLRDGQLVFGLNNAYLVGAVMAFVIAWRFNKLLLTIIIGMATFLLWHFVVL